RARVEAARGRARARFGQFDRGNRPFRNGLNKGVVTALAIVLFGTGLATNKFFHKRSRTVSVANNGDRLVMVGPDAVLPPEAPLPPFFAEAENRAERMANAIDRTGDAIEKNLEEAWNDGPVAMEVSTNGAAMKGAERGDDAKKTP